MKASEATCSAIVCASIAIVLMRPIAKVAAANTPTSATIIAPIGRPSRQSAASSPPARRHGKAKSLSGRMRGSIREAATRRANISVCDRVVARPEQHAELAEDQRVVGKSVERDRREAREQHWPRTFERRKRRPPGEVEQTWRETPLKPLKINSRVARDLRR